MSTNTPPREKLREMMEARRRQRAAQPSAAPPENAAPAETGDLSLPLIRHEEFRYRENRTIRRGDLFELKGGPIRDGRPAFRMHGVYRFQYAYMQGKRWLVSCEQIDPDVIDRKTGQLLVSDVHVVFVAGTEYLNRADQRTTMRPYRIKRLRDETARKRGLQAVTRSMSAIRRRHRSLNDR